MFRLTREVRFAINGESDAQLDGAASNSYAGFPSLTGRGAYYALRVTLAGSLDRDSQYLINIKGIDDAVGRRLRDIHLMVREHSRGPEAILRALFDHLSGQWPDRFHEVALCCSPFVVLSMRKAEYPTMRLSQKFEFSASHRLHNPALDEETNRRLFGKCNNPRGHGHNYEVQVTLTGKPDGNGLLVDVPSFERVVAQTVIDRFDHRNLNEEVVEFRQLIPTVENIAAVIYGLLKPKFQDARARLASVTVWETGKTWCEYSE
jgi:6-pyruvoyltetrahydropterin/6-carboxytetrahydropterin synthase